MSWETRGKTDEKAQMAFWRGLWLIWIVKVGKVGERQSSFPISDLNLSQDIYWKLSKLIFMLQIEGNMFSESTELKQEPFIQQTLSSHLLLQVHVRHNEKGGG